MLAGAIGLWSVAALAGDVYTWTDEQGVAHFSDRAPDGEGTRRLELGTPVLVPMGDNVQAAEQIAEARSGESTGSRSGAKDKDSKNNSAQARKCARYREQLEVIQSRLRAGYSNAEGNRLRERRRTLNGRLSRECILG